MASLSLQCEVEVHVDHKRKEYLPRDQHELAVPARDEELERFEAL